MWTLQVFVPHDAALPYVPAGVRGQLYEQTPDGDTWQYTTDQVVLAAQFNAINYTAEEAEEVVWQHT